MACGGSGSTIDLFSFPGCGSRLIDGCSAFAYQSNECFSNLLQAGFTENLLNPGVKKFVGIGWLQYHCGISPSPACTGTGYGNNFLISPNQASISRHRSDLADHLHPLPKNTQGLGDYVHSSTGLASLRKSHLIHRPTKPAERMSRSQEDGPFTLDYFPIRLGEFLGIRVPGTSGEGYNDYPQTLEDLYSLYRRFTAGGGHQYILDTQFLRPLVGKAEHLISILFAGLGKIDYLLFHHCFSPSVTVLFPVL